MSTWNSNEYTMTIKVRGQTTTQTSSVPFTVAHVKSIMREMGVSDFNVYDTSSTMLDPAAFPYSGDIEVREYNAPKGGYTPSTPVV